MVVRYHRRRLLRGDARGGAGGGDEADALAALPVERLSGRSKAGGKGGLAPRKHGRGRAGTLGRCSTFGRRPTRLLPERLVRTAAIGARRAGAGALLRSDCFMASCRCRALPTIDPFFPQWRELCGLAPW